MTLAAAKTEQPFDRGLSVATDIEDAFKSVAKRKPPDELEQCCSNVADARNKRDIEFAGDSFVPGTGRIYIKTWGCSHNRSDSEYMAGILAQAGYEITDAATDADLWLLNSCTVKTPSEDQLRALVHGPLSTNKNGVLLNSSIRPPVVLSGCVPQAAPKADWMKGISIVGVQMIDRVVEVVEETLKGNTVRLLGTKRKGGKRLAGADLNLPKIRKNPLIEILAINSGCLNHCTYCKTKQARGDLASYPIDQLVARAQSAFEDGVKEIWLTSEDLGAYGRDLGVTLPDLLDELVKVIPQGCMLRLGMTNPPYIMDHLPEIAAILQHERVYAFLHIPVQSGSDAVLADMKREYTAGQFETVVRFMSEKIPGIHIATDVICAFPTETQDDFQETYDLIDKYRFPSVFINQFYPRPGTPAAKMPLIDTVEVAHNKFYEQILIDPKDNPNGGNLMGATVRVRITSIASKFAMRGKVLVDDDHSMGNAPITIAAAKIATVAQRTKLCCGAAGGWLLPLAVVVLSYWLVAWLLP